MHNKWINHFISFSWKVLIASTIQIRYSKYMYIFFSIKNSPLLQNKNKAFKRRYMYNYSGRQDREFAFKCEEFRAFDTLS